MSAFADHPMCGECWIRLNWPRAEGEYNVVQVSGAGRTRDVRVALDAPVRMPIRVVDAPQERCCWCQHETCAGIYVRASRAEVEGCSCEPEDEKCPTMNVREETPMEPAHDEKRAELSYEQSKRWREERHRRWNGLRARAIHARTVDELGQLVRELVNALHEDIIGPFEDDEPLPPSIAEQK